MFHNITVVFINLLHYKINQKFINVPIQQIVTCLSSAPDIMLTFSGEKWIGQSHYLMEFIVQLQSHILFLTYNPKFIWWGVVTREHFISFF